MNLHHIPRPIRFIGNWHSNDWTIKIYGISQHNIFPAKAIIQKAKEIAVSVYPSPAKTSERYGIGFMIIHDADLFNQIVFDWWERENELRHIVYKSSNSNKSEFENITQSGEAFCIWELKVISYERDAWMKWILKNPTNFNAYLAETLNIDE